MDSEYVNYMNIIVEEYSFRNRLDDLICILTEMGVLEVWQEVIEGKETADLDDEFIESVFYAIKNSDSIYGDTENKVKYLVVNAKKIYPKLQ